MGKAWSHLPNAHHIDWVLKSVKENSELWVSARDAAWNAAWDAVKYAVWNKNRYVSLNVVSDEIALISNSYRCAARHVIAALIAYDDCDQFLSMSYERLKVWAAISEDPRAILLLPMVYVREQLMSNAWSHLPNARHIDWVLKSLKERQELWFAAMSAAKSAVRVAARAAAKSAAWGVARDVAWGAAWGAAWDAVSDSTRDAVYDAILSLIAYDDCDRFLDMSYEKLQIWAVLSEDPRAVLLLPMVYVREQLNERMVASA